MSALPFKAIRTENQYYEYCKKLRALAFQKKNSKEERDVIELLTVLIEKYDSEHNPFNDTDPVELLHYLLEQNNMRSADMAALIGISKNQISDILNYRRGMSRDVVRKLTERFKLKQEAFNRPYRQANNMKVKKSGTG